MVAVLAAAMLLLGAAAHAVVVKDTPFPMPEIAEPVFPDRTCSIADYGATQGGALNTEAFARAISACADAGGGTVLVPPGEWLTGPIHLKSNINLHLDDNARVVFSAKPEQYLPVVLTRWEGIDCYNYSPLVYCNGCENTAVTGKGVFDGQGKKWWQWKLLQNRAKERLYKQGLDGVPVEKRIFGKPSDALRPAMIQFINSRNILLEDFTAANSPFWTNHIVYSENVVVRNIRADTPYEGPNTDGLNIDSSRNVYITGFHANVGDDGFCVKSGRNEDGRRVGRPVENVVLENCEIGRAMGGFIIGSEMSGGVNNILVRNCKFTGTDTGLRYKSLRGRGAYARNIFVRDIEMENIRDAAISINMFYSSPDVGGSTLPSDFENMHFDRIRCNGASDAISVVGLPEKPLRGLHMSDIDISARNGMSLSNVAGADFTDINLTTNSNPAFIIKDSTDITLSSSKPAPHPAGYIGVSGGKTANIQIAIPGISDKKTGIVFSDDASPDAVTLK